MRPVFSFVSRPLFVLSVAFFSLLTVGNAIDYERLTVTQISSELGLPGGTVRAIGQDQQGIMWFGTETAGLVSYDGSEFVDYGHDPNRAGSLSSDYVSALLIDRSNRVWIATINGLNLFDRTSREFVRFEEAEQAFAGGVVFSIEEDEDGSIWFGGSDTLARLDPATREFRFYKMVDESGGSAVELECLAIHQASSGQLFLGTQRGLFEFDRERGKLKTSPYNGAAGQAGTQLHINAISEGEDATLWLSTEAGVSGFDTDSFAVELIDLGQIRTRGTVAASVAQVSRDGVVWVGTFFDGIRVLKPGADGGTTLVRTDPMGLKSDEVRSLFEDRNGLIWIGTKEQGVFVFDSRSGTFPHFSGLVAPGAVSKRSTSYVRSIGEDHAGILWFGTLHDGIVGFDRSKASYTRLHESDENDTGLSTINTRAVQEDASHNLWFGTPRGLLRFGPDRKSHARFSCEPVRELKVSSDDLLYVGTRSGLKVFDLKTESFVPFPAVESENKTKLLASEISTIMEDRSGAIWIGTWLDGLFRYNPAERSLKLYAPEEGNAKSLNSKMVRSLLEDDAGTFWVGTKLGGLNRYVKESDSFERIGLREGLPFDSVYSLLDDEYGRLWLSMNGCLARYEPTTGRVSAFTKEYGLQSNRFDELNAAIRTKSGELVVGARNGFNVFKPREIERREQVSNTIITSLKILNNERIGDLERKKPFHVTYDKNYLTLSFALTDYSAPKRNEFAYWLEGLDKDWIYSGTRNYATYTELPAGRYTFHVNGKSPSGDWSSDPYHFEILVTPPFWLTRAFLVASALFLVGGAIMVYVLQGRRASWQRTRLEKLVEERTEKWQRANQMLEESKQGLEDKVQERTKDLVTANERAEEALLAAQKADQLKSAFLANMSHEIRTPMNAILGFSCMLNDEDLSREERTEFMTAIDGSGQELISLIDDILDLSTIEAGQIKLFIEDVDLMSMFGLLLQTYRVILDKKGKSDQIRLELSGQALDPLSIRTDEVRLRQILSNFLNNAVKFTDSGSVELGYTVESGGRWIRFYVKDTGIGIEKHLQDEIFERFRKIEGIGKQLYRGSGLGLSISRQLSELLGGEISVTSEYGKGASFFLRLPLEATSDGEVGGSVSEISNGLEASVASGKAEDFLLIVAEDEDSNFELIKAMLRNDSIKVVRAVDGVEAVELARKHSAAKVILMDVSMPRMNGIEAARQIREENKSIAIIAHTAHVLSHERERIMTSDFNCYLSKPLTRAKLMERLEEYFR